MHVFESSALASSHNKNNFKKKYENPEVKCQNCGISGHVIDNCYRLKGFPPNFKFTNSRMNMGNAQGRSSFHNANSGILAGSESTNFTQPQSFTQASNEEHNIFPFSSEQINKLLTLLQNDPSQNNASTSTSITSNSDINTSPHFSNMAGPIFKDDDWTC